MDRGRGFDYKAGFYKLDERQTTFVYENHQRFKDMRGSKFSSPSPSVAS